MMEVLHGEAAQVDDVTVTQHAQSQDFTSTGPDGSSSVNADAPIRALSGRLFIPSLPLSPWISAMTQW